MSNDIRIDTQDYERKRGKPIGRTFWTFKVISTSATMKDRIFTTAQPLTYQAACDQARELAQFLRSELIVLIPDE